jgi:hypothetical protein
MMMLIYEFETIRYILHLFELDKLMINHILNRMNRFMYNMNQLTALRNWFPFFWTPWTNWSLHSVSMNRLTILENLFQKQFSIEYLYKRGRKYYTTMLRLNLQCVVNPSLPFLIPIFVTKIQSSSIVAIPQTLLCSKYRIPLDSNLIPEYWRHMNQFKYNISTGSSQETL